MGKYGVLMPMAESSFVFSTFANQNSWFLSAGPPRLAPNCSRSKSGFDAAKLGRAAKSELRPKRNPVPWRSLLPRLVMTLIAPVALRPADGSEEDVDTWNSWMPSCEMFSVVVPTCSSTASTPSIVIRASRPLRLPIETPVYRLLVGSNARPS